MSKPILDDINDGSITSLIEKAKNLKIHLLAMKDRDSERYKDLLSQYKEINKELQGIKKALVFKPGVHGWISKVKRNVGKYKK